MAYFDSAKNRAMWNRELQDLRAERERRATNGYKPVDKEAKAKAQTEAKTNDPRHRKINLAELERIEARSGKVRKIKRPTRENAYVRGQHHPEIGTKPRGLG